MIEFIFLIAWSAWSIEDMGQCRKVLGDPFTNNVIFCDDVFYNSFEDGETTQ